MTSSQVQSLIHCLEVTIHSTVHSVGVAHAEKLEMLDSLDALKSEFGMKDESESLVE